MLSHDHEMLLIVASNSVSSEHRLPVDLHQRRVFSLVDSFFTRIITSRCRVRDRLDSYPRRRVFTVARTKCDCAVAR